MEELSMGMSNDFEVAVEEGARWCAWERPSSAPADEMRLQNILSVRSSMINWENEHRRGRRKILPGTEFISLYFFSGFSVLSVVNILGGIMAISREQVIRAVVEKVALPSPWRRKWRREPGALP